MYRIELVGKDFKQLQKAVENCYNEINEGRLAGNVTRDMDLSLKEELVSETPAPAPAPAPAPVVTPAPVVEAAPVVLDSNVELDSTGCPWDERIHTKQRTKVANGSWKKKRGVTKEEHDALANQLRALAAQQAGPAPAPVMTPPAPAPAQDLTTQVVQQVNEMQQAPTPVATPAPASLPTMNTGGQTLETFSANLPMVLNDLINNGKIDQDYVNTLKTHFQVQEIWQVNEEQKKQMFDGFVQAGILTTA